MGSTFAVEVRGSVGEDTWMDSYLLHGLAVIYSCILSATEHNISLTTNRTAASLSSLAPAGQTELHRVDLRKTPTPLT
jgi:hypothetical protein